MGAVRLFDCRSTFCTANWDRWACRKSRSRPSNRHLPDDPVLSEVVRRSEVYHPSWIYLFGPAARGNAGPDSDYDIMVILPDGAPPHLRRGHPGYQALRGIGAAVDVQVWPQGDFNRQLHLKASFPSTIVREGKQLFGA